MYLYACVHKRIVEYLELKQFTGFKGSPSRATSTRALFIVKINIRILDCYIKIPLHFIAIVRVMRSNTILIGQDVSSNRLGIL